MRSFASPIVDRKIRFALVGCGRIANNHFAAIRTHAERAELVAVTDVDSASLARAVSENGAKAFPSLTSLLAGCAAGTDKTFSSTCSRFAKFGSDAMFGKCSSTEMSRR